MLSSDELIRYSRQTMVKDIGEEGQLRLSNASVLIVGMGGLGNPVSLYLNAAGVGNLYLTDNDHVDITNLQRQIMFTESDVGTNKADAAKCHLEERNGKTNMEAIDERLDQELCDYYFPLVDLVIDCTDNIATRYLLNKNALAHNVPLIIGAATGFDGQAMFINSNIDDNACYQCLFPESNQAPVDNCQTVGIVGPVLSIIAGTQALMAIKHLAGLVEETNQLTLFDGRALSVQKLKVRRQANCPACGG